MRTIKASAELIRIIRAIPAHKRVAAARFAEKKMNEYYAIETRVPVTHEDAIANVMLAVESEVAYQYGVK